REARIDRTGRRTGPAPALLDLVGVVAAEPDPPELLNLRARDGGLLREHEILHAVARREQADEILRPEHAIEKPHERTLDLIERRAFDDGARRLAERHAYEEHKHAIPRVAGDIEAGLLVHRIAPLRLWREGV